MIFVRIMDRLSIKKIIVNVQTFDFIYAFFT